MSFRTDSKSARLIEQSNRIGVDFLIADLNTGLTFLTVARISGSDSIRNRNLDRAQKVYRTILRLLPRVLPQPDQAIQINRMLAKMRSSLEEAGYSQ